MDIFYINLMRDCYIASIKKGSMGHRGSIFHVNEGVLHQEYLVFSYLTNWMSWDVLCWYTRRFDLGA